jgi:hypothetical protein
MWCNIPGGWEYCSQDGIGECNEDTESISLRPQRIDDDGKCHECPDYTTVSKNDPTKCENQCQSDEIALLDG